MPPTPEVNETVESTVTEAPGQIIVVNTIPGTGETHAQALTRIFRDRENLSAGRMQLFNRMSESIVTVYNFNSFDQVKYPSIGWTPPYYPRVRGGKRPNNYKKKRKIARASRKRNRT